MRPLFFAQSVDGDEILLAGTEGRHAADVMRLNVGEEIDISDGMGQVVHTRVESVRKGEVAARVLARTKIDQLKPTIAVAQALIKGESADTSIDLLTQVGADLIIPWQASRSVSRWDTEKSLKGLEKWRQSARTASKQARRPRPPQIEALATPEQLVDAIGGFDLALILHESASSELPLSISHDLASLLLIVGPEGGLSDEEISKFEVAGAQPVRLGPTVLRASSAGAMAVAVLMAVSGRWSSHN